MKNIDSLMREITELPEEEFDKALLQMAVLSLNTIHVRQGRKFLKGFVAGAMKEKGPLPIIRWQGPQRRH